jgi:hypothetical protein
VLHVFTGYNPVRELPSPVLSSFQKKIDPPFDVEGAPPCIAMWLSRRFITKYGFDRRKVSTKILEFLYVRYLMDIGAAIASALIIVIRAILIFEIEGVPYSGTMPAKTETIITIGLSVFILQGSLRKIREFKLKVIKEIPKLTKELGVTQKHLKKNA